MSKFSKPSSTLTLHFLAFVSDVHILIGFFCVTVFSGLVVALLLNANQNYLKTGKDSYILETRTAGIRNIRFLPKKKNQSTNKCTLAYYANFASLNRHARINSQL